MGWALHVQSVVIAQQGHVTDALSLFDQALAVTGADPAMDDLRLLLQLNKSVALAQLDRCAEALAAAEQARDLADQIGTVVRASQAHCALGLLLFDIGRWDDALTEVQIIHPSLIEPGGACSDLGLAAIIRFHRGEPGAARRLIAAAVPYAAQLGSRIVGVLTLAHSMDRENDGALPEALAVLTDAIDGTEELDEAELLFTDTVRLATQIGDLSTAQAIAHRADVHAAEYAACQRQHRQVQNGSVAGQLGGKSGEQQVEKPGGKGSTCLASRLRLRTRAAERRQDGFRRKRADAHRRAKSPQTVRVSRVEIATELETVRALLPTQRINQFIPARIACLRRIKIRANRWEVGAVEIEHIWKTACHAGQRAIRRHGLQVVIVPVVVLQAQIVDQRRREYRG